MNSKIRLSEQFREVEREGDSAGRFLCFQWSMENCPLHSDQVEEVSVIVELRMVVHCLKLFDRCASISLFWLGWSIPDARYFQ